VEDKLYEKDLVLNYDNEMLNTWKEQLKLQKVKWKKSLTEYQKVNIM
jgi:hypothetical protein